MVPAAAIILTVLIAAGFVLLHIQPQLIQTQNVSNFIWILILPAIISIAIVNVTEGYWTETILPKFINPRSENMLVKVFDLWIAYTFFSLLISFCIFVYLELNTHLDSPLTEKQSFITSILILIFIFITRIRVAGGHKDPFRPINIFLNTIIILMVINLILKAESLPNDVYYLYSFYFENLEKFLNFFYIVAKYVYIGCISLALFGEILIKYLYNPIKKT